MHLGLPDLGFMDLSHVADHVMAIRCVVDLSLIVDIDTGFGNAEGRRKCCPNRGPAFAQTLQTL
jgi:2-methylisocitrate lyase-like PEP mutase family enzyme